MAECEGCVKQMPCVQRFWTGGSFPMETAQCHVCRGLPDADCEKCQEEGEERDDSPDLDD